MILTIIQITTATIAIILIGLSVRDNWSKW
jgi:hypothetical protein